MQQDKLNKYPIVNSDLTFITITKNPYSWLLSLYRKPYQRCNNQLSFEGFLKSPWKTIGRDNFQGILSSPVELWNLKNRSYLQLDNKRALNTTTEDLFENPSNVIQSISDTFSINRKSEEFINHERSTKDKSKDHSYYRDYYLSEKWREKLSNESIEIINSFVDKELMSHYGYNLIS